MLLIFKLCMVAHRLWFANRFGSLVKADFKIRIASLCYFCSLPNCQSSATNGTVIASQINTVTSFSELTHRLNWTFNSKHLVRAKYKDVQRDYGSVHLHQQSFRIKY